MNLVDPIAEALRVAHAEEDRTRTAAEQDRLNPDGAYQEPHPGDVHHPTEPLPRNMFPDDVAGGAEWARHNARHGGRRNVFFVSCVGCHDLAGTYYGLPDEIPTDPLCRRCRHQQTAAQQDSPSPTDTNTEAEQSDDADGRSTTTTNGDGEQPQKAGGYPEPGL